MIFATDSPYWIKRITEDEKRFPGEITITRSPATNGGVIEAVLSQRYIADFNDNSRITTDPGKQE